MTKEQPQLWQDLAAIAEKASPKIQEKMGDSRLAECVVEFPKMFAELRRENRALAVFQEANNIVVEILDFVPTREEPCASSG